MSDEIKNTTNNDEAQQVEEQPTAAKRGRKSAEKKEFTTADIQAVLQTPEAQAVMQSMVAQMLAAQQPTVIKVEKPEEDMVTLLYMGAVAEGSMVSLGEKLGEIQGRGGTRKYPKSLFLENMNPNVLKRLKDRRLIVIDGLTDDEKDRFCVNYTDGELVGKEVYYKLLDMDVNTVISIFKKACFRHKQLIASLYMEAYNSNDNRINQPLIEKLNKASKDTDKDGMFTAILKDMARALGDNESDEE